MSKPIFLFLAFLISFSLLGQDYERVDATIQLYPEKFDNAKQLSDLISRDFNTDEEKVRAMYSWIIENIVYDPDEYKQFNYNFKNYRERNQKEKITREKIIKRTLQNRTAVCEGYAMLLKNLCERQGIPNYLVRGDIKTNFNDIGRPFKKTHMWNVITLEGKQFLFDATWGAGKYNEKFIKEPSYFFYKTSPELFIKTHYPDMFEDAFLENTITRQDFSEMPIIIEPTMLLSAIEKPRDGIISTEKYFDEFLFSIKNVHPETVSYSFGKNILPVNSLVFEENIINFAIPIELGAETLLIYFDDKPALAYKIE